MAQDSQLPFVYINVAMTADGKIAFADRRFVPFGSASDREELLRLRTRADAVMAGARTVDLYPVNLGPGGKRYRALRRQHGLAEYNLRVVVSGSATLNPRAEIFRHCFSSIIIVTTGKANPHRLRELRKAGAEIEVCGEETIDLRAALQRLRTKWGVKRLLCEGGGEINAALFRAGLVDELYLTICPFIFGGADAPTLADGEGASLADAATLKLSARRCIGDELFLVYQVAKKHS